MDVHVDHAKVAHSSQVRKDAYRKAIFGTPFMKNTQAPIPPSYMNIFTTDEESSSPFVYAPSPAPSSTSSSTPDASYSPSRSPSVLFLDEPSTPKDNSPLPSCHYPRPFLASPARPAPRPRARNAFIIFRSHFIASGQASGVRSQLDVSRLAGVVWTSMSDEDKREWRDKAEVERRERLEDMGVFGLDDSAVRGRGEMTVSGKGKGVATRVMGAAEIVGRRKAVESIRGEKKADVSAKKVEKRKKRVANSQTLRGLPVPVARSSIQIPTVINVPRPVSQQATPSIHSLPIPGPFYPTPSAPYTPDPNAFSELPMHTSPLDASWPTVFPHPPLDYFTPTPTTSFSSPYSTMFPYPVAPPFPFPYLPHQHQFDASTFGLLNVGGLSAEPSVPSIPTAIRQMLRTSALPVQVWPKAGECVDPTSLGLGLGESSLQLDVSLPTSPIPPPKPDPLNPAVLGNDLDNTAIHALEQALAANQLLLPDGHKQQQQPQSFFGAPSVNVVDFTDLDIGSLFTSGWESEHLRALQDSAALFGDGVF